MILIRTKKTFVSTYEKHFSFLIIVAVLKRFILHEHVPNAGQKFSDRCYDRLISSFLVLHAIKESGYRAVRTMPSMYVGALVQDPFEVLIAFFQDSSMVDMAS